VACLACCLLSISTIVLDVPRGCALRTGCVSMEIKVKQTTYKLDLEDEMVRSFRKLDEFRLTRGRCIVVACPMDIDEHNFHWLLETVILVDDEYLVVRDIRIARVQLRNGQPYVTPDGVPVLGLLVRQAGRAESVAYTVFRT
jgi:hypothetical protein